MPEYETNNHNLVRENVRLKAERDALKAENERLKATLESIIEYRNGDRNDAAMFNALNYIEDIAADAIRAESCKSAATSVSGPAQDAQD